MIFLRTNLPERRARSLYSSPPEKNYFPRLFPRSILLAPVNGMDAAVCVMSVSVCLLVCLSVCLSVPLRPSSPVHDSYGRGSVLLSAAGLLLATDREPRCR